MLLDPYAIHIYTDGSCYANPGGRSGFAVKVHYPDHLEREDEYIGDFSCEESTNNRMELSACVRALQWARKNGPWDGVGRIQIVTDSTYVKENVSRAREWKKNDWRNQYGEPKGNSDLWKQLLSALSKTRVRVDFEWVKGKKTPISNEIDKAAKIAAKRGGTDVDRGYKPGSVSRSMVRGAATRFPAQGQSAVIRPYRKNVMRKGEDVIRFDIFSEDTQSFVESRYAYATPALAAELHRTHGYRVQFNDNQHYPQILELLEEVPLRKPTLSPQ